MPRKAKTKKAKIDVNQLAYRTMQAATDQADKPRPPTKTRKRRKVS